MLYEPNGTELVVIEESKIPCGKQITTIYRHPETWELLRKDVRIEVDRGVLVSGKIDFPK